MVRHLLIHARLRVGGAVADVRAPRISLDGVLAGRGQRFLSRRKEDSPCGVA